VTRKSNAQGIYPMRQKVSLREAPFGQPRDMVCRNPDIVSLCRGTLPKIGHVRRKNHDPSLGHVEGVVPVEAVVALKPVKQNDGRHSIVTMGFKMWHVKRITDRLSP
jgi:hypothetical protein